MKLVSFLKDGKERAGLISGEKVFDFTIWKEGSGVTMNDILMEWDDRFPILLELSKEIENSREVISYGFDLSEVNILAPVPNPATIRDGYAFRQHVETARRNRGLTRSDPDDGVRSAGPRGAAAGPARPAPGRPA